MKWLTNQKQTLHKKVINNFLDDFFFLFGSLLDSRSFRKKILRSDVKFGFSHCLCQGVKNVLVTRSFLQHKNA